MEIYDEGVIGNDPLCGDYAVRQVFHFAVPRGVQTGKSEHIARISRTAKEADSLCVFLSVHKFEL